MQDHEVTTDDQGFPIKSQATSRTENLPAMVTETEGDMIASWTSTTPALASNLDVTSREGLSLMTRALAKVEKRTRNAVGDPISLVGYIVHVAEIANLETGIVEKKLRGILVTDTGALISTMSKPVLSTLCKVAKVMPREKWEPPLRVQIREWEAKAAEGATYCDMIVLEEPPEGKQKKERTRT